MMKEPQTGSGTFRFWRRGKPSCGAVATPWWCWKAPKVARCGMHCGISVWPSRPPVEVWGVADPVGCASPVRFLLPMTRNERFWVTRGWPRASQSAWKAAMAASAVTLTQVGPPADRVTARKRWQSYFERIEVTEQEW